MDIDKIVNDIQNLVNKNVPITIKHNPLSITYDKEWKEGGTTPIKNKKDEITGYKEDYTAVTLSSAEIKKIDEFIASITE
jgi:hypothetical protein